MHKQLCTAYFTGSVGNSMGLFFIGDGRIEGIDVGGMKYSGIYRRSNDNSGLVCRISIVVPANTGLITGFTAGGADIPITTEFELPEDFAAGRVITIQTPTGPINVRFESLTAL